MAQLTRKEVLKQIREMITSQGSAEAVADDLGVSPQYLSDVLKNRRGIGPKLQKALGIKQQDVYVQT